LTLGAASTSTAPAPTAIAATTTAVATQAAVVAPAPSAPASPEALFTVHLLKNQNALAEGSDLGAYTAALIPFLGAHPEASVTVTGHTDADGDPDLNRRLSLARAEQVKRMLVNAGVAADRISTAGAGADHPIADNLTSKGKALNRRVEITLNTPAASPQTTTP
jgi:hypothetical protein